MVSVLFSRAEYLRTLGADAVDLQSMSMAIRSERDAAELIHADAWMMTVLRAAQELDLPDWWIGAGFVRNKVWDVIEHKQSEPTRDVDLVYFNAADVTPETDWSYDERMKRDHPFAEWEVRNQARMHYLTLRTWRVLRLRTAQRLTLTPEGGIPAYCTACPNRRMLSAAL
jgi:Nucleotidyltransferase